MIYDERTRRRDRLGAMDSIPELFSQQGAKRLLPLGRIDPMTSSFLSGGIQHVDEQLHDGKGNCQDTTDQQEEEQRSWNTE